MSKKTIFKNKFILWSILSIVFIIIVGTSFIIGYNLAEHQSAKKIEKKDNETQKALKELQELVDKNIKKDENIDIKKITSEIKTVNKVKKIDKEINKSKKIVLKNENSEAIDYAQNSKKQKQKTSNPIIYTNKPKLVIIMDDMSFAIQVKKLKNLHMKITPSFFPPTHNHPYTAKYAKEFKHYMVHFPMQATNPNFHEEPKTLHINLSLIHISEPTRPY
jgi:lipopolysaccharide export LptBFGC system permease protein LptF